MYVSNLRAEPNACGRQIDLSWTNPTKIAFPNFQGIKIVRLKRRFPEASPPKYSADISDFSYDGTLVYDGTDESFSDKELHGETVYYYTFYTYDDNPDPAKVKHFTNRTSRIAAMATSNYGLGDELYQLMPAIYKRYDTKEELQRLLEIFGCQLDLLRSCITGTRNFFDLDECDGVLLPLLAQWIGWQTNLSLDLNSQRNEIRYAPELYKTVGIAANLRALVNRLTNWDSQIKEFFHNIFFSNNPEQLTIWRAERHNGNFSSPKLVTLDMAYEGKLATVLAQDGRKWLFYHARNSTFLPHSPAKEGITKDLWHIWYKIYNQTEWLPACCLTFDGDMNKYPAALQKSDGNFWVFWSAHEEIGEKSIQQIKLNLLSAGRPARPARLQGTQPGPFAFAEGDQFKIKVDDGILEIVTFCKESFPDIEQVSIAEVVTLLNRALPDVKVIAADDGTIILTSPTTGSGSIITVPDSTVATKLGLAAPVTVRGSDAVAAELIGSRRQPFSLTGIRLVIRVDQGTEKIINFTTESSASEVAATINSVIPGIAQDDSGKIRLTSPTEGEASFIGVNVDSSTAASELGFGAPLPSETSLTVDIEPTVFEDNTGNIWLFWRSRRTGRWKIWYNCFDAVNNSWGIAKPLTNGLLSDRWPAVLFDSGNGGKIWVFWSRKKTNGLWNIFYRTTTNLDFGTQTESDWTEHELPTASNTEEAECDRKEPAAILLDDNIELYFSSNRTGGWNIWYKTFNKALDDWTAEVPATSGHFTNKAPAILEDEVGSICLLFRSNESIAYPSRVYPSTTTIDSRYAGSTAIDVRNEQRIGEHARFEDILHYTYDTEEKNEDWYARDTIGIYLTPDAEDQQLIIGRQELVKAILDRFLPIQLRAVFIINPVVHRELIYTYDFPVVKPQRLISEQFFDKITSPASEVYPGLTESHKDKVPDWIWLRSWREEYPDHHNVDFATIPIETKFRTWHIGLESGG